MEDKKKGGVESPNQERGPGKDRHHGTRQASQIPTPCGVPRGKRLRGGKGKKLVSSPLHGGKSSPRQWGGEMTD